MSIDFEGLTYEDARALKETLEKFFDSLDERLDGSP